MQLFLCTENGTKEHKYSGRKVEIATLCKIFNFFKIRPKSIFKRYFY